MYVEKDDLHLYSSIHPSLQYHQDLFTALRKSQRSKYSIFLGDGVKIRPEGMEGSLALSELTSGQLSHWSHNRHEFLGPWCYPWRFLSQGCCVPPSPRSVSSRAFWPWMAGLKKKNTSHHHPNITWLTRTKKKEVLRKNKALNPIERSGNQIVLVGRWPAKKAWIPTWNCMVMRGGSCQETQLGITYSICLRPDLIIYMVFLSQLKNPSKSIQNKLGRAPHPIPLIFMTSASPLWCY